MWLLPILFPHYALCKLRKVIEFLLRSLHSHSINASDCLREIVVESEIPAPLLCPYMSEDSKHSPVTNYTAWKGFKKMIGKYRRHGLRSECLMRYKEIIKSIVEKFWT